MSSLEAATRHILERLAAHGVPAAVVGGLAVSARSEPRFTRDADVCVSVEGDTQAEVLIRSLRGDGYAVCGLIEARGYARGRDVVADLAMLRAEARQGS